MKKALIMILAVFLLLGIAYPVIAIDMAHRPVAEKNIPKLQMNDDQKAKMIALKTQMLELKKQIIKQNLENGTITAEQAKLLEERINAKIEALKSGQLGHDNHRKHPPGVKPNQRDR
jgi:hypothetical protein